MNITEQIEDYKAKIESLAIKAADFDSLNEELTASKTEVAAITEQLTERLAEIETLVQEKAALETQITDLKGIVESMEAEKASSDARAMEILAGLGLNNIPVVTITESDRPTAEQIREQYSKLTGIEKAKFYKENKNVLLNGTIEE